VLSSQNFYERVVLAMPTLQLLANRKRETRGLPSSSCAGNPAGEKGLGRARLTRQKSSAARFLRDGRSITALTIWLREVSLTPKLKPAEVGLLNRTPNRGAEAINRLPHVRSQGRGDHALAKDKANELGISSKSKKQFEKAIDNECMFSIEE
jgi:hypothetical protein